MEQLKKMLGGEVDRVCKRKTLRVESKIVDGNGESLFSIRYHFFVRT